MAIPEKCISVFELKIPQRPMIPLAPKAAENAKNGIIDIPHLSLLRFIQPEDLVKSFREKFDHDPVGVSLPIVSPDGLLFPVEGTGDPLSPFAQPRVSGLTDFFDVVRAFAAMGLEIYLILEPSLKFTNAFPLYIRDVFGDHQSQLCIYNPGSRDLLKSIVITVIYKCLEVCAEIRRGCIKGVVLDLSDILPLSAENDRMALNCFCPACESWWAENAAPSAPLQRFRDFPSPWNLVLKQTRTGGIAYIENIQWDTTPHEIEGLTRQRGWDQTFNGIFGDNATVLLSYMRRRHEQIISVVQDLFDSVLCGLDDFKIRRILLIEGVDYCWTSGLFLGRLHEEKSIDELWYDPWLGPGARIERDQQLTRLKPYRTYLWRRARYFIDSFFEGYAGVVTGYRSSTDAVLTNMLVSRARQTIISSIASKTTLSTLLPLMISKDGTGKAGRIGYVSPILDNNFFFKAIQEAIRLRAGLSGDELIAKQMKNESDISKSGANGE